MFTKNLDDNHSTLKFWTLVTFHLLPFSRYYKDTQIPFTKQVEDMVSVWFVFYKWVQLYFIFHTFLTMYKTQNHDHSLIDADVVRAEPIDWKGCCSPWTGDRKWATPLWCELLDLGVYFSDDPNVHEVYVLNFLLWITFVDMWPPNVGVFYIVQIEGSTMIHLM